MRKKMNRGGSHGRRRVGAKLVPKGGAARWEVVNSRMISSIKR